MLGEMKTHAYIQRSIDDAYVILILYVDYMLITGKNKDGSSKLKENLSQTFLECVLLGIGVMDVFNCVNLSNVCKILKRFIWKVQSLCALHYLCMLN